MPTNFDTGNYRYSKCIAKRARIDRRIKQYECDQDGHWVILAAGYERAGYGGQTIRTDTVKDMLSRISREIKESPRT